MVRCEAAVMPSLRSEPRGLEREREGEDNGSCEDLIAYIQQEVRILCDHKEWPKVQEILETLCSTTFFQKHFGP